MPGDKVQRNFESEADSFVMQMVVGGLYLGLREGSGLGFRV